MFVQSCQGQGCLARTHTDTHRHTKTHTRTHTEQCRPICGLSAQFNSTSLPFCPFSSPFHWQNATPQSASPDRCRNPLNLKETLAHKKPMIQKKKLQKTLQPLLGNGLRLGQDWWKITVFAEGKWPRAWPKVIVHRHRRLKRLSTGTPAMALSVWLSVGSTTGSHSGILAQPSHGY